MKSLKDILAVVIGLLAAAGAIFYFYKFVTPLRTYRVVTITDGWLLVLALSRVCLWLDLFSRSRKQGRGDPHYTVGRCHLQ